MRFTSILASTASLATAQAALQGFNYGSTFTTGAAKAQSDFEAEFNTAKDLVGTSGFTSARLYTMIQEGTTNTPIEAIPAAIGTQTTLLLGLWASAGQSDFDNEVTALTSAIDQYGTAFTSLIAGISVGSEDLYRISPTGIENLSGAGANPDTLVSYINQVRTAISGTSASGASIGHVDTWTAWVNSSNSAVVEAVDWLGMDAYPYFQNTIANGIDVANSTFFEAYDNTVAYSTGKAVWVTETGWPVSGPQENEAVASTANAQTYWDEVGCTLFGSDINIYWYTLQDAEPTTPSPSFGIVGGPDLSTTPLFNLTCPAGTSGDSISSAVSSATSTTSVASATAPASSASVGSSVSIVQSPGPETSPASASISQTSVSAPVASASVASGSVSAPASSAPASSASAASETSVAPASGTTALTTSSTTVVSGGQTSTTFLTTVITITSCPTVCPTTLVSATSAASQYSESAASSPVAGSSALTQVSASEYSSLAVALSSPAPATSSASSPAAPSGTSCPANLNGEYQYPHLIVPVDSSEPTTAYGTSYNGTITPEISTIFNFDIPASYAGETCSLVFLFPEQAALETSAYTFNGQGGITVNELSAPATEQTTYDTVPSASVPNVGSVSSVQSGNSYVITSHACGAGERVAFEVESTGGLSLEFFEDYNPSPLGFYITVC